MVACPQDRGLECEVELGEGLLAGPACTRLVFGWTLCCAGHGVIAGGRVASRIMACNGHVVATGSSAGWENVINDFWLGVFPVTATASEVPNNDQTGPPMDVLRSLLIPDTSNQFPAGVHSPSTRSCH